MVARYTVTVAAWQLDYFKFYLSFKLALAPVTTWLPCIRSLSVA